VEVGSYSSPYQLDEDQVHTRAELLSSPRSVSHFKSEKYTRTPRSLIGKLSHRERTRQSTASGLEPTIIEERDVSVLEEVKPSCISEHQLERK
jgi:hypothetical protein